MLVSLIKEKMFKKRTFLCCVITLFTITSCANRKTLSEQYFDRNGESKVYIKKYTPVMNQEYKGKTLTDLLDGFLKNGTPVPDVKVIGSYKVVILDYNDMWTQGAFCMGGSYTSGSAFATASSFGNSVYGSGHGNSYTNSYVSCSPEKNYKLDCSYIFTFDKKTDKFSFVIIKGNGCQLPPDDRAEYYKKIEEKEETIMKPFFTKIGVGVDNIRINGILDGYNAADKKDVEKKYDSISYLLDLAMGIHINENFDLYYGFKLNPTKLDTPTGYYGNDVCSGYSNSIDFYYDHLLEMYLGIGLGIKSFKVNFDVGVSYPDASYHFFCTGTQKSGGGGGGGSAISFEIRPEFYFGKRNQHSIGLYYQTFSRVVGENEFSSIGDQVKMSFDVIKYGVKYNYYIGY
jgi:hypothetical protein